MKTMKNNEKGPALSNFSLFFKNHVLNLKIFNKILFAGMIVLGILYLAGTNDLAIQGFALSDLKEQRNRLAAENKKLELKAMALSSYNIISSKVDSLKMVAVGEIDYISAGSGIVAKK
ncbi:MAG: hypothetical protein UU95_C0003G0012 [Parcubacteria group bacterium GW2011_GWC2_42_12]|uniref:Cell division protein FtsL n=2 Tax=Candidatus Falkowiibacteriota TaxID=1752728 RepID=A0A1F5SAW2_9BACT|nr:MAG: hypothetical protein UU43_C0002G0089 [Candidatus Falkowbacteria bacterium GW2011_GWA2_41_14]KKS35239.1 MAG: hypothetical protein UU95_C0003G0012 [Parcubacteria group bacterium GW2011_GWC2_42_12]OGF23401.1 MAG: hypothetical protein A3D45_02155 [Candidatus Falkowbacteria bacterium RIFCSPHIGHO2_02_FULL_42_9]